MMSSNDDDFPPNPFRSNPTTTDPVQPQQQRQQQQQQDAFFNTSLPPSSSSSDPFPSVPPPQSSSQPPIPPHALPAQPLPSTPMMTTTTTATAPSPTSTTTSWWGACRSCCRMDSYKAYFDVESSDIQRRLTAVFTSFYKPDAFRTDIVGVERTDHVKGPDLYGPFWTTMTLVFGLAVTSNIAAYLHTDNVSEFEYDITHLVRATTVLALFALGVPSVFWVLTQCMGMQALKLVDWVCLYGYALLPYVPATLLCLVPVEGFIWAVLLLATIVSALLVVRNVASPLLSADVSQAKAGPLLLAILGMHVVFLLVLKVGFYSHG